MASQNKRNSSNKVKRKVIENIQSGFFAFANTSPMRKNSNKYRVSCTRECEKCNLAIRSERESFCQWHPDSDKINLDFINSRDYPELFI